MDVKDIKFTIDDVEIEIRLGVLSNKVHVNGQKIESTIGLTKDQIEFDLQTDEETIHYQVDSRPGIENMFSKSEFIVRRNGKVVLSLVGGSMN